MQTQLQPIETEAPGTQCLVEGYAAALAERRQQLREDLSLYTDKVHHLERLDPLDFTGLGKLYRAHVQHIELLLDEFDDDLI